jgi:3-deoxy-D-manno-octulosonate 8-phosphate phosphatase (KDO 8-P phosphatase)
MFENIKAVAMDVDGVLTDGTFWWGINGEEFKRFCFADVTGIPLARQAGLELALVSGESSAAGTALVQRFADKLKIGAVYKGCHDKAGAVRDFAEKHHLQLSDICYIGDDVSDIAPMGLVGLAAAPANAQPAVIAIAHFITSRNGGFGAVREVLDTILEKRQVLVQHTFPRESGEG